MSETYVIPKVNFESLCRKLEKVAARCDRQGTPFYMEVVGTCVREDVAGAGYWIGRDGGIHTAKVPCYEVRVEGLAVINGWSFVGTIEHTEAGNLIRTNPKFEGELPARFQTTPDKCDHCKVGQSRKTTVIITHEDGTFLQVGKACLKEYMGISAPDITYAMEKIHHYAGSSGAERYLPDTDLVLRYAAEVVRKMGYRKTSEDPSTADTVWDFLNYHMYTPKAKAAVLELMAEIQFSPSHPEVLKMVDEAIAWLDTVEDGSDYIHNLRVITHMERVDRKHLGFLSSLFAAHRRSKEWAEKKDADIKARKEAAAEDAMVSKHVGNIKDRLEIEVESFLAVTSWEGPFGFSRLWKIRDHEGNVFIWITANNIPEGTTRIKGTVKAHEFYDEVAQTVLTRCKIL